MNISPAFWPHLHGYGRECTGAEQHSTTQALPEIRSHLALPESTTKPGVDICPCPSSHTQAIQNYSALATHTQACTHLHTGVCAHVCPDTQMQRCCLQLSKHMQMPVGIYSSLPPAPGPLHKYFQLLQDNAHQLCQSVIVLGTIATYFSLF